MRIHMEFFTLGTDDVVHSYLAHFAASLSFVAWCPRMSNFPRRESLAEELRRLAEAPILKLVSTYHS